MKLFNEFTTEEQEGLYGVQLLATKYFYHKEKGFLPTIYVYPRWRALNFAHKLRREMNLNVEAKSILELRDEDKERHIYRPIIVLEGLGWAPPPPEERTMPPSRKAKASARRNLALARKKLKKTKKEK